MLLALLILSTLMTSCATNRATFVYGKDGADLIDGCPSDPKGKMWMTFDYAKKHYHLENHK